MTLKDVHYVPGAAANLVSVSRATESGAQLLFKGDSVINHENGQVIAVKSHGKLYAMRTIDSPSQSCGFLAGNHSPSVGLWHNLLGHPGISALNMLKHKSIIQMKSAPTVTDCKICLRAKATIKKPKSSNFVAKRPLELIHCDVSGPFRYAGLNQERYFLTTVDAYSNYVNINVMKSKGEATDALIHFITKQERLFAPKGLNYVVGAVRTDHGGEFVNHKLHQWFQEKGIYHQLTVPHQSFSNGKAERFHQTIQVKARTMLIGANMPDKFWSEAALCAVYLINRTPTRVRRHTPFELFHGETPGYKHLRVFGFTGYATVPAAVRDGKLSDTAQRAAMVGYDRDHRAYRI